MRAADGKNSRLRLVVIVRNHVGFGKFSALTYDGVEGAKRAKRGFAAFLDARPQDVFVRQVSVSIGRERMAEKDLFGFEQLKAPAFLR